VGGAREGGVRVREGEHGVTAHGIARGAGASSRQGLSWLQRWAITQGEEPGREPREVEWVRKVAYP
jgi:hypothetical protein